MRSLNKNDHCKLIVDWNKDHFKIDFYLNETKYEYIDESFSGVIETVKMIGRIMAKSDENT